MSDSHEALTAAREKFAANDLLGAEAAFAKALALAPRSAEVYFNFGQFQLAIGAVQKAILTLKRAVNISPTWAEAHLALAKALRAGNRPQEALASAQRATQINPKFAAAFLVAAQLLRGSRDFDAALTCLQQALSVDGCYAPAYCELGAISLDFNRVEDALDNFREALRSDPSYADAHVGMGHALRLSGRLKEATDSLQCAERLNPKLASAHIGLGMVASVSGSLDEAIRHFDRAIELSPAPAAHYNRALALLRHGRLAEGWRAYEWRWTSPVFKAAPRHQKIPRWRGEPLAGKKLLVWGEQGVGDEIIFATMVPDLIARGAELTLECDDRLAPLFRRTWPEVKVVEEPRAPAPALRHKGIQLQAAGGSLGEFLRLDFASFAKRGHLLEADRSRATALREEILRGRKAAPKLIVGISWISNTPAAAAQKSTNLAAWAPILKQSDVSFVDLQYGETAAERADVERALGMNIAHLPSVDLRKDLDGVAALAVACDLVISVSNTTVHLAGAVGAPVWALIPPPAVQPWYWFAQGEDTPWYDSVRLFRQAANETWSHVIKRTAAELRARLKR
jgi:tetratricopeptide (TPR) repeat protein